MRLPEGLLTALGGPRGARARSRAADAGRLAPVVLLLGLPLVVAALRQASCADHGWEGRAPVWRQCASPLLASLVEDDAGRGVWAYLTGAVPLDLPVLRGVVATGLATLAPGAGIGEQRWVLVLWTLLAAVVLAGLVVAVGTVRGAPDADPVALALSPVLALSVLLSTDLVPVALAVVAVWAWARHRPELAGVLLGLAVLGGPQALLVLLALAVVPPPGVPRAVRRLLTSVAVTTLLVVGPVAALDLGTLVRPLRAWWTGGAGPGSLLFVPELALHPLGPGAVAAISVLGLLLAAALVVVLAARRPAPPVAGVALVGLVAALVTAPSAPVTAALWLVPFVALAGVPWRDHLVWAGAEAVHLVAWYGWVSAQTDTAHGLPAGWYATALTLRVLAVTRLGWVVWARASWGDPPRAGTLQRLPIVRPVDEARGAVGGSAYPPVTEGP